MHPDVQLDCFRDLVVATAATFAVASVDPDHDDYATWAAALGAFNAATLAYTDALRDERERKATTR